MSSNIMLGLLFAFAAVVDPGSEQIFTKDLSEYLPDTCINDWEPLYIPKTFVGDNLETANIYHRFNGQSHTGKKSYVVAIRRDMVTNGKMFVKPFSNTMAGVLLNH